MDKVLIRVLPISIILFIVPCIIALLQMRKSPKDKSIARYPIFLTFIGAMVVAGYIFIGIFVAKYMKEIEILIVLSFPFALMLVIGYALLLLPLTWRVYIKEKTFEHRNIFGRKKSFHYDEISKIVIKKIDLHRKDYESIKEYVIYIGKHHFALNRMTSNADIFYKKLQKECVLKTVEVIYKKIKG